MKKAIASIPLLLLGLGHEAAALEKLNIPSDPSATYFDEGSSLQSNGFVQIHTKRIGKSGVSHAVRVVNCSAKKFEYIWDSDDKPTEFPLPEEANAKSPLSKGSISYWVSGYACQKHDKLGAGW